MKFIKKLLNSIKIKEEKRLEESQEQKEIIQPVEEKKRLNLC